MTHVVLEIVRLGAKVRVHSRVLDNELDLDDGLNFDLTTRLR